jgi:hypothetical protein
MKQLINWIAGFFSSESATSSSKRLVGIVGAFTLFFTLYSNSHSEAQIMPADSLVWATATLSAVALGLASVKEISDLFNKFKGKSE